MNRDCHLALAIGQNVVAAADADKPESVALQHLDVPFTDSFYII